MKKFEKNLIICDLSQGQGQGHKHHLGGPDLPPLIDQDQSHDLNQDQGHKLNQDQGLALGQFQGQHREKNIMMVYIIFCAL